MPDRQRGRPPPDEGRSDVASVVQDAYPRLLRAARRLTRSAPEAEDVVQEAFVETLSRYPDFHGLEQPMGYLITVLYRAAFRRGRRSQREVPLDLQQRLASLEPDPDAPVMIAGALSSLGPKQRACVVLRYLCDLDEAEIAATLGCKPSTVRSQLARGMAKARREFSDEQ